MADVNVYELARVLRDRVWAERDRCFGDWQPDDADHDDAPHADPVRWWYLHGKAEAYAAIMTELETAP